MKRQLLWVLTAFMLLTLLAGCTPKSEETEETGQETKVQSSEGETKEAQITEEEQGMNYVGTEAVVQALPDENSVVVDTRSSAAFNGWALKDEVRGGHIKGATLFSAEWVNLFEDDEALLAELERMHITSEKNVVLYGYGTDSAEALASKLDALGFESLAVYKDGFSTWSSDENLGVNALEHYEMLVYPEWVNENLEAGNVAVYEVSWGPGEKYAQAHIPNAAHINTDDFEVGPLWNRKTDAEIEEALLKNGVTHDMTVVLYGADSTASARIASIMMYAGVEDVRLLDGGFQGWQAAGFEVAAGGVEATEASEFGVEVPQHPEYIIDMEEAKTLLESETGNLVSIRSWAEYIGETSGYDYIEKAGRIDGAVYGFAGSDPWHMEDYRTVSNTMLNYEDIAVRWAESGITADDQNAFYCGTGWRASEAWFYAYVMGFENPAVYDGGWKEWSETEGAPIAVGEPEVK